MTNQQEYAAGTLENTGIKIKTAEPVYIEELRAKALAAFNKLQAPGTHDEDWKYTSVKSVLSPEFSEKIVSSGADLHEAIEAASVKGLEVYRIILINGLYSAELSAQLSDADKSGLTLLPFHEAVSTDSFKAHFNRLPRFETEYFAALNLGKASRGLFIEVATGFTVSRPLHIINLLDAADAAFLNTRNLVVVHALGSVELIESTVCKSETAKIVLNHTGEFFLGDQARASQIFIQQGNQNSSIINRNETFLSRDCNFSNHTYTLQGAFTRNNLNMYLEGPGIEAHMYGFYQTQDGELVDNHTLADHQVNNCMSSEHYKGILNGKSSGVFNGKVVVHPDAQKTNAYQQNNSILLGKNSTMNSKPELVIFADDVKCSHGSTIGQLNPDHLFYLKARGIEEETAKLLLIKAFAHELTLRLQPEALREHLNELIG